MRMAAEAAADTPAEVADIDLNDPEVQASATKIQASFRGHQARKEVAAMKATDAPAAEAAAGASAEVADIDLNDPEVQASATKIQASFRGHQARKEVAAMKATDAPAAEAAAGASAEVRRRPCPVCFKMATSTLTVAAVCVFASSHDTCARSGNSIPLPPATKTAPWQTQTAVALESTRTVRPCAR